MKNKEFYDLSNIYFLKSSRCGNPVWKIYYSEREDYCEEEPEEPIEIIKRNYDNRVNDLGEWLEKEHNNEPKFNIGDYVFDINLHHGVITSHYKDNNISMYKVDTHYYSYTSREDALTLSPLDEKEFNFLKYQIEHITPNIDCIVKSSMLNGNCIQLYSGKLCISYFRFNLNNEKMYEGMETEKKYKLSELGLKKWRLD